MCSEHLRCVTPHPLGGVSGRFLILQKRKLRSRVDQTTAHSHRDSRPQGRDQASPSPLLWASLSTCFSEQAQPGPERPCPGEALLQRSRGHTRQRRQSSIKDFSLESRRNHIAIHDFPPSTPSLPVSLRLPSSNPCSLNSSQSEILPIPGADISTGLCKELAIIAKKY